jgi:hypothetical protein
MLLLHHGRVQFEVVRTVALAERPLSQRAVEAVGVEPTSSRLRGGCLAGVGHTSLDSSWIVDIRYWPLVEIAPRDAGPLRQQISTICYPRS